MMKVFRTTILLSILAAFISASSLHASDMIITAAEGAGAESSTLAGTYQETFNNLPTGVSHNVSWNGVGAFDSLNVNNADQYGGAGGTKYAVEGLNVVNTTTLSLDQKSQYFGLWWSAGDPSNVIDFYNSGTQVAHFTAANLINLLPSSYNGNPDPSHLGQDAGEKFGFINFIADATTSWDQIIFSNGGGSGFEADNYTSRVAAWNPYVDGPVPGTPYLRIKDGVVTPISSIPSDFTAAPGAPAPPLIVCLAFAGILFLQSIRKIKLTA